MIDINETISDTIKKIILQREEILTAFIAKYGFEPDKVEQIVESTLTEIKWYVRERK